MNNIFGKIIDRTFWKFILVGVANTVVGTGIMFVFYNVFHFSYWISTASNYFFGSIFSYFLNRFFTFKNSKNTAQTLPKFVINISLCYLVAYGMAKPLAAHFLIGFAKNIQENVSMLIGMCLFVGLNYIGQRFFVFNNKKH